MQVKCSEQAMVFWAMQYGEFVEVLEPISVREKITENVRAMLKKYEG